jgi:hypothetical protein
VVSLPRRDTDKLEQARALSAWRSSRRDEEAREGRRLYDACVSRFLHTMVRITDPEKSRAFYEALGFHFERDMDIVRNGEMVATN